MSRFITPLFCLILICAPEICFCSSEVIVISDRSGFKDPDAFSPKQLQKRGSLLLPTVMQSISTSMMQQSLANKRTAILIHGYNNTYADALHFFQSIVKRTGNLYDEYICYLWPGGDHFWEYLFAKQLVTGSNLSKRVDELIAKIAPYARSIDVLAHSMGCRLILEAQNRPGAKKIHNLFLFAPAIDNEALEKGMKYYQAVNTSKAAFVFFSDEDPVERYAYPFIEWDRAFGAVGPENIKRLSKNVHLVNCSEVIDAHGEYATSDFVFAKIAQILALQREVPARDY